MEHLAYYNTGCQPEPGLSRPKLIVRRLFRKILLPTSRRLVQILASLCQRLDADEQAIRDLAGQLDDLRHRQHDLAAKYPATVAFGWDYVALTRRLAVLEEHVDRLLSTGGAEESRPYPGHPEARPARTGRETAA